MNRSPFFLLAQTPHDAASFLLAQKGSGKFVLTLNTELLARSLSDPDFAKAVQSTPYRVCDSVGAKWILQRHLANSSIFRIPGVDLGKAVLSLCARQALPVFLLGGKEGVAFKAKEMLTSEYPKLRVVGCANGYFTPCELPALRGKIHRSGARVVLVCLGSPYQEKWIIENRSACPDVELFLPLGGSMDVYAGELPRAPLCWRKMGMEWLYRLLTAPNKKCGYADWHRRCGAH